VVWSAQAQVGLELDSTALAVRQALDQLLADRTLSGLTEDRRGTLWTVLAEVLNNIVEHAYAGRQGRIRLSLWHDGASLAVEVMDRGAPMPGFCLPRGQLADFGAIQDLPEGGFGWFLIREMTQDLQYDRIGGENRLRFCLNGD
jgi:serine/threonine-protein kinase RsbW